MKAICYQGRKVCDVPRVASLEAVECDGLYALGNDVYRVTRLDEIGAEWSRAFWPEVDIRKNDNDELIEVVKVGVLE